MQAGRFAKACNLCDLLLLVVIAAYALAAPYTKVEEVPDAAHVCIASLEFHTCSPVQSFTLQATHDMLHYGTNLSAYDHHEFPGVVPRSFLPALAYSALAAPFHLALHALGVDAPLVRLYFVRLAIGLLSWCDGLTRRPVVRALASALLRLSAVTTLTTHNHHRSFSLLSH